MTSLNNDGANNQEENGENRQNNNNNYQNLIRNHLQQIQTIHQETNSHFEDIMRRISSLRNMQNNLNINESVKNEIRNTIGNISQNKLRIIDEISIYYRNHIVENNKKINRTRN